MRDMTPATGHGASPDFGEKTGEPVALHNAGDAAWSYLYEGTDYAGEARAKGEMPPLGDVAPGMLQAAGVDVGGAAVLLVRRDRFRRGVRRTGV